MNGFWLSKDPVEAARLNRDSHVVATCREMAIMVHAGLAHHLPEEEAPETMYNVYGPQSKNNSIARWAGESRENWKHAFDLVKALNYEYVVRERKSEPNKTSHASWTKTLPLWDYREVIPHGELTAPPMFGPTDIKEKYQAGWENMTECERWDAVVHFYQEYYRRDKVYDGSESDGISKWSKPRAVPGFMRDLISEAHNGED